MAEAIAISVAAGSIVPIGRKLFKFVRQLLNRIGRTDQTQFAERLANLQVSLGVVNGLIKLSKRKRMPKGSGVWIEQARSLILSFNDLVERIQPQVDDRPQRTGCCLCMSGSSNQANFNISRQDAEEFESLTRRFEQLAKNKDEVLQMLNLSPWKLWRLYW